MTTLKTTRESVSRTLSGDLKGKKVDYSFSFDIPNQPTPVQINFNMYNPDGSAYMSGYFQPPYSFSPSFADVSQVDWSIPALIVADCQGIIETLKPKETA